MHFVSLLFKLTLKIEGFLTSLPLQMGDLLHVEILKGLLKGIMRSSIGARPLS